MAIVDLDGWMDGWTDRFDSSFLKKKIKTN